MPEELSPIEKLRGMLNSAHVPTIAKRCNRTPSYLYTIARGERERLSIETYRNIVEDGFKTPLSEFFAAREGPGPGEFDELWKRLRIAMLDAEKRQLLIELLDWSEKWAEKGRSGKMPFRRSG